MQMLIPNDGESLNGDSYGGDFTRYGGSTTMGYDPGEPVYQPPPSDSVLPPPLLVNTSIQTINPEVLYLTPPPESGYEPRPGLRQTYSAPVYVPEFPLDGERLPWTGEGPAPGTDPNQVYCMGGLPGIACADGWTDPDAAEEIAAGYTGGSGGQGGSPGSPNASETVDTTSLASQAAPSGSHLLGWVLAGAAAVWFGLKVL